MKITVSKPLRNHIKNLIFVLCLERNILQWSLITKYPTKFKEYTHYHLKRTDFKRTKYWTFHNLRTISTGFGKVKDQKMEVVFIIIRNFESLFLTHNIIDFETTKLNISYPWILGILRVFHISQLSIRTGKLRTNGTQNLPKNKDC